MTYSISDFKLDFQISPWALNGSWRYLGTISRPWYKKILKPVAVLKYPESLSHKLGELGLLKRQVRAKINFNTLTLVDPKNKLVFRMGLSPLGNLLVLRNYEFLTNRAMVNSPKPISFGKEPYNWSCESLISGKKIDGHKLGWREMKMIATNLSDLYKETTIQEWSLEKEKKSLIWLFEFFNEDELSAFEQVYKIFETKFGSKQKIARVSIHGDLTQDNILRQPGGYAFIDFDRSQMGMAEMDFMLLMSFYAQHKRGKQSTVILFEEILKLRKSKQFNIQWLYELYPELAINGKYGDFLWACFVLRIWAWTLTTKLPKNRRNEILELIQTKI